jgi:hypothetical protein
MMRGCEAERERIKEDKEERGTELEKKGRDEKKEN